MKISEKKGGVMLSYIQMVLNVLVKFIYTPFLLMALGQNEYGLFSLVMSFVGYLAVLELGFGSTVTRYTVKYNTEGDKESLKKLYGTLSVVYILMGVTAMLICVVLSYCAPQLFGTTMTGEEVDKLRLMMVLCGMNLLFTFPLQISASVLVAYERFIFKNGINLIRTFLQPIVLILLLYLVQIKSIGSIFIVTLFNLLTYLAYYVYSVKKLDFRLSIKNFEPKMIRSLLTFSVWMFCLMLFEQLQYNSGQFILGLFQGTEVIAVWGIAMIFILNYRSLSTAITNVFLPSYISDNFKKDEDSMANTTYKMTRLQGYVLFSILANFILFGQVFIDMWAGEDYHDAYTVVLIVMVPMTFALLLDFSYLIQIATNKLKYRIVTLFSGFIISFFTVYYVKGIDLISYAYVIASSMLLGQIIFVIYYMYKHINIEKTSLFKGLMVIALPPTLITGLFIIILNQIHQCIATLILMVIMFNCLLACGYWLVASADEKKILIRSIKRK